MAVTEIDILIPKSWKKSVRKLLSSVSTAVRPVLHSSTSLKICSVWLKTFRNIYWVSILSNLTEVYRTSCENVNGEKLVAFISQPYWVEVMFEVEAEVGLRLTWTWFWFEVKVELRLRFSWGCAWVEVEIELRLICGWGLVEVVMRLSWGKFYVPQKLFFIFPSMSTFDFDLILGPFFTFWGPNWLILGIE